MFVRRTRAWKIAIPAILLPISVYSTLAAAPPAGPQAVTPTSTTRHALLVGCTAYPLIDVQQLVGPANDVVLMRTLLEEKFKFPKSRIVTLAESEPVANKPTRANIEREFARLAKAVRKGDQVVILMGGHGMQQPDANPPDPNDPEPDGFDEVFLPSDAKPFDRETNTIPGAIVDDELGLWVRRIRDAGAIVWIIVDSCHSGTIVRGSDGAVVRRVAPEQLIPADVLAAARGRAPRTRGGGGGEPEPPLAGDLSGIVALYAAQPEQSTIELPLPPDSDQPEQYGLLTFVVNKVLRESPGTLTYRELAHRIETQYAQWGRAMPTPAIEGRDRDREVLGLTVWPNRSSIVLRTALGKLVINAGALQGLTKDSVLSVTPIGGMQDAPPVGYVRVSQLGPVASEVVACEFKKVPAKADLPDGGACEVVYADAGLRKLNVAIEVSDPQMARRCQQQLSELIKVNALIDATPQRRSADWVLHGDARAVYLEPATGFDPANPAGAARFGPAPFDDQLGPWLGEHLRRIARAQNLLRLVQPTSGKPPLGAPKVKLLLTRSPAGSDKSESLDPLAESPRLAAGDQVECKIQNQGESEVDVTLLYIDSGYGIQCVFPPSGTEIDNRIYPGESPLAFKAAINDETVGLEHLVMIAVPADGPKVNFGVLEQPTLPTTRGPSSAAGLNSPLGQLLETAMYGRGTTRGREPSLADKQQISLFSWRVAAGQVTAAAP